MATTGPDDGAFPFSEGQEQDKYSQTGMTMREWYAGMAVQGILANANVNIIDPMKVTPAAGLADAAFKVADAMLAEAKKARPS